MINNAPVNRKYTKMNHFVLYRSCSGGSEGRQLGGFSFFLFFFKHHLMNFSVNP